MERVKKQKSFRRSYRPVVIWLEDLAEIVSTLKETAKDVQISTEDYNFPTVEEVAAHHGARKQFAMEITSSSPYVSLEFNRMAVRSYVSSGPQSAQLFHDIDVILARRQRSVFYTGAWWWAVPVMIGGPAGRFFPEQTWPIVTVQSAFLAWFVWVSFVTLRRSAVINLQRRSEARPFFERTKDQLLLLLIGGLVGIVITFAGVVLKERFYPSTPTVNAPTQP